MLSLSKMVHVVAMGLWFGSNVFFTFVVALVIFNSFETLALQPGPDKPAWLPTNLGKAEGNQLAGLAVGPIFPWFFLLQGICGLLALATCYNWSGLEPQRMVHKARFALLSVALVTVIAGWFLAQKVSDYRFARYSPDPGIAETAKAEFGRWHLYSLGLNFVTIGLVAAVMAQAAFLPGAARSGRDGQENATIPEHAESPIH